MYSYFIIRCPVRLILYRPAPNECIDSYYPQLLPMEQTWGKPYKLCRRYKETHS